MENRQGAGTSSMPNATIPVAHVMRDIRLEGIKLTHHAVLLWVRNGEVPAIKLGGRWFVEPETAQSMITRARVATHGWRRGRARS